ncbi:hypothetical protein BKA63DRAFT_587520 [Paraphoma chrysanthemicola]|nr:hypothetical protein BKA63DRAFT_587520 [Paraphoma chrysanthemicola]
MLSHKPGPMAMTDVLLLLYATYLIILTIYVRMYHRLIRRHVKRTWKFQKYHITMRTTAESHPQPIAAPMPVQQRFATHPLNAQRPQRHRPPNPLQPQRPRHDTTCDILARIEQGLILVDQRVDFLPTQIAVHNNNNTNNRTNVELPDESTTSMEGLSTAVPNQNEMH